MGMLDLSVPERLWYFMEMIHSSNGVWTWCYSGTGELYYSSSPYEKELNMFFTTGGCWKYAMETGKSLEGPFLMSDSVGLMWLGEFADMGIERRLVLIGPVFFGTDSSRAIEEEVKKMGLSVEMNRACMKILRDVPIINGNVFMSMGKMLNYMVTMKDSRDMEISFQYSEEKKRESETGEKEQKEISYERMREQEEMLLQCVREGNPNYTTVFGKIGALGSAGLESGNHHRDSVNKLIIFTAACARAAVEGGVTPKEAMETEAKYIRAAEQQTTFSSLVRLNGDMLDEFISKVNASRQAIGVSDTIRDCCSYIRSHLTEALTLSSVAKHMGYTEYYLTRKFSREMGRKMLDYIKDQRLEYAKIWLTTTNRTIQDICDSLHFGSRSYFSRVFKEKTGMSPAVYREKVRRYNNNKEEDNEKGTGV